MARVFRGHLTALVMTLAFSAVSAQSHNVGYYEVESHDGNNTTYRRVHSLYVEVAMNEPYMLNDIHVAWGDGGDFSCVGDHQHGAPYCLAHTILRPQLQTQDMADDTIGEMADRIDVVGRSLDLPVVIIRRFDGIPGVLPATGLLRAIPESPRVSRNSRSRSQRKYSEHGVEESEPFMPERIYAPRYPNRMCPPEHPRSLDRLEKLLNGPAPERFLRQYEVALPDSALDIELLNEKEDFEACRYFNKHYEAKINVQYRLCENQKAWYPWNVVYYKSKDFFFIVKLEQQLTENTEAPDCRKSPGSTGRPMQVSIFLRDGFFQMPVWN